MMNYTKNRMWDRFVDDCEADGLDPQAEDFDAWCDEQDELAAEERAERAMEYAMEERFYPEYD